MAKIKIIRIISRLNVGGPAIHTILLSSELNKSGYEDILVCGSVSESEGDMAYLAEDKNIKPVFIPELGREISFIKDIKAFLKIYWILKKEKPDIVHTHAAKAGALGRLAALLAGTPVKVHTFHGHIFDGYFSPRRAKVFLLIERFLSIFTDKVVAVSGRVREDLVERLKVTKEDKCAIIPLGLELEKFLDCDKKKGNFRKAIGVDDTTLLVGIVGRLVPIKNHNMFIEVAKKVKDDLPNINVKFVIVGDGELRQQLEEYNERLGLNKDVIFTGWTDDMVSVYADLDVVALTSLNEGTPVSLIEAIAAGKPVIATDVGGIRDMLGDEAGGMLAKSNDAADFSNKLASLLNNLERAKSSASGRRDAVIKKYSKERLVNDLKLLYRDLVRTK